MLSRFGTVLLRNCSGGEPFQISHSSIGRGFGNFIPNGRIDRHRYREGGRHGDIRLSSLYKGVIGSRRGANVGTAVIQQHQTDTQDD